MLTRKNRNQTIGKGGEKCTGGGEGMKTSRMKNTKVAIGWGWGNENKK